MWMTLLTIWVLWAIVTPLSLALLSGLLRVWTRGSINHNLAILWQEAKYGHFMKFEDNEDYAFTFFVMDAMIFGAALTIFGLLGWMFSVTAVLLTIILIPAIILVPRAAVDVKNGRPIYTHPNTLLLENNSATIKEMQDKIDALEAAQQENK